MYTKGLVILFSLSTLVACGTAEPRSDAQQAVLAGKLQGLLADYNARHHTHIELPALAVEDAEREPGMIASANYSSWSIRVNRLWLKKDPCIVYKEAVAHELAHLLVDYVQFGAPQAAMLSTRTGSMVVAFNGPATLRDPSEEHGKTWQAMALELGAHPCEEGYCRSSHPYSKASLTCSAADYALLLATPPVPAKTAPRTQVAVTPMVASWTSSRTLFDSQAQRN